MVLPLKWMPAYSHGGLFTAGQPTVVVVHCTESDNNPGSAEALMGPNWFGGAKAGTSTHKCADVDSICEGVHRTTVAWHAGPGGNVRGIAYEFCGRVAWTAAQWRAPAQLQMLRNAAPHIADDLRAMSAPARWLSLAQLGSGQRGMCTHNDIRLAFGGTTHSDPGPNFPYVELLSYVAAELAGTPVEDDMPSAQEVVNALLDTTIPRAGSATGSTNLRATLAWLDSNFNAVNTGIAAANAKADALREVVSQLAAAPGQALDMSKIDAAIDASVKKSIESIDVTVNTKAQA